MLLLLDTHAFLWWVEGAPTLSSGARRAIGTPANECLFSVASCWEMAIKLSLRKLRLDAPIERFVPEQLAANGFRLLDVEFADVARVATLRFHHRDPFDRLLAATTLVEGLTLVSADPVFDAYGLTRLW